MPEDMPLTVESVIDHSSALEPWGTVFLVTVKINALAVDEEAFVRFRFRGPPLSLINTCDRRPEPAINPFPNRWATSLHYSDGREVAVLTTRGRFKFQFYPEKGDTKVPAMYLREVIVLGREVKVSPAFGISHLNAPLPTKPKPKKEKRHV